MRAVTRALARLPRERMPRSVEARLSEAIAKARPRRASVLERFYGALRPPLPVMRMTLVSAGIGVVAAVTLGVMVVDPGALGGRGHGPQEAAITRDFVDEMVLQHSGYVDSRPLADDSGMQMISHNTGR